MATTKPITFDNVAASGGLVDKLRLSAMISQEINLLLKDNANLRNTALLSYQEALTAVDQIQSAYVLQVLTAMILWLQLHLKTQTNQATLQH